ncbi:hypothetical protein IGI04_007852 [Brassica rapa subsp. trilocularis]|uniref:Uncharacterized protein n=1 Tax=Brassica rapa subsp. trilocularis TaxID=1813537 RepID=A0ABQ7NKV9_BRACM|nr:hypothetical protein IGI04_007852 [Brassica rapa subsp. trilocularis]
MEPLEKSPVAKILWRHRKLSISILVEHRRVTSQSDLPRSLPARATSSSHSRFDAARHEEMRREGLLVICFDSIHKASSELATLLLINRHFPPKSSILDHPKSNLYAHEFSFPLVKKVSFFRLSEYLHSQCFDIPQNWFDNHLYHNICLRSLENS